MSIMWYHRSLGLFVYAASRSRLKKKTLQKHACACHQKIVARCLWWCNLATRITPTRDPASRRVMLRADLARVDCVLLHKRRWESTQSDLEEGHPRFRHRRGRLNSISSVDRRTFLELLQPLPERSVYLGVVRIIRVIHVGRPVPSLGCVSSDDTSASFPDVPAPGGLLPFGVAVRLTRPIPSVT